MRIPDSDHSKASPRYVTINEAASLLKVSQRTIYRWMKEYQLRAFRVGKVTRISANDLNAFLETNSGVASNDGL